MIIYRALWATARFAAVDRPQKSGARSFPVRDWFGNDGSFSVPAGLSDQQDSIFKMNAYYFYSGR